MAPPAWDPAPVIGRPEVAEVLAGFRQFGPLQPAAGWTPRATFLVTVNPPGLDREALADCLPEMAAAVEAVGQSTGFGALVQVLVVGRTGSLIVAPLPPFGLSALCAVIAPGQPVAGLLSVRAEKAATILGQALAAMPGASGLAEVQVEAPVPSAASALTPRDEARGVIASASAGLDAFGKPQGTAAQVAGRPVVCFIPSGREVTAVAGALGAAVEAVRQCGEAARIGEALRVTVRARAGTMMWRSLANGALLFVAAAGEVRPGLAQLQFDKVAQTLGSVAIV